MTPEEPQSRLVLELELENRLPAGQVLDPAGDAHPFHGWLELMSAIAAAAGARDDGPRTPR
jgi:hypothetical protein